VLRPEHLGGGNETAHASGRIWVAFGLVWLPFAAEAQQAKLPRLGFLANHSPSRPEYQTFLQTLRELGYVEGKNIAIEARYAQGNFDRLPELARELVRLDVDLLFVFGDQGVKAAKQATDIIPILVVACDPLESMVVSIARPVGKVTGATCIPSELTGKRLQILKELVPALVRVAVLYNPADRNKSFEFKEAQGAAHGMNLTLQALEANSPSEIDAAFVRMASDQTQALMVLADPFMNFHVQKLADLSLKNRLPAIYGFREFADAGGLLSYGASLHWLFRRAASYVDKIFKGANPGDLPIEQPTTFELLINLKTSKALGVDVPPRCSPSPTR
jgi:putative tryptophan/tyrosine transport system substrate-binding protein